MFKQNQGFNVAMKVSKADLDDFYKRLESLTPSLRREVERKVLQPQAAGTNLT